MYPQGVAFHLCRLRAISPSELDIYLDTKLNDDLWKAVENQETDKVIELLNKKADPNCKKYIEIESYMSEYQALSEQIIFLLGNCRMLSELIKAGMDVTSSVDEDSILLKFIKIIDEDRTDLKNYFQVIIGAGVNINTLFICKENKFTPLMYALLNAQYRVAKLLIELGADVTIQQQYNKIVNNRGGILSYAWVPSDRTAYNIAVQQEQHELVALIKAKMDEQK